MEQIQHCIFIASNYTNNKRKGLHYLYNETNFHIVMGLLEQFKANEGVAPYFVTTNSTSIQSVKDKDPFFRNVDIAEGTEKNALDVFIKSINNLINSFDMCILFLSRNSHTLDEIKKILLLFYCEYVSKNNRYPFKDPPLIQNKTLIFKSLDTEFKRDSRITGKSILKSLSEEIVFSKFLNSEGGFTLMNDSLKIYFKIIELSPEAISYWYNSFIDYCQNDRNFSNKNDTSCKITKFYIKKYHSFPEK